jgi:hypothetical protein
VELTSDQLEFRKEKAVRFTRDVLNDPERTEEIADENLKTTPRGGKSPLVYPGGEGEGGIMATRISLVSLSPSPRFFSAASPRLSGNKIGTVENKGLAEANLVSNPN